MSALNELIAQIQDTQLRNKIEREVARSLKQKKFGLVFENHLPEAIPLPEVEIKVGSRVSLRGSNPSEFMIVRAIEGNEAVCVHNDEEHTESRHALSDLHNVALFGESIYPYLKFMDSVTGDADSDLWHTLIEADNYHALQLLQYLYAGQVDCIYIDPPYNKPDSHDWKYNCNYVDGNDSYRHSKWLSMLETRLKIAKKLLNPKGSVLIVTIDELEYNHLGCLLEQTFPEATIQMVTSVISGKGVSRDGQFSRVEEYVYFITLGNMPVLLLDKTMLNDEDKLSHRSNAIDFLGFRRRNKGNFRTSRPNQFYPVIVNNNTGQIVSIGDAITPDVNRFDVPIPEGCTGLWPLDPSGSERIWSLVPESARILLSKGCLKVVNWNKQLLTGSVKYLASGMVSDIDNGIIIIDKKDEYGNIVSGHYNNASDDTLRPRKVWVDKLHNASSYGTLVLKKIIGEKRFDFPKSLYAVHDALRFFIANKPNALILDFFAGSGTTLHAVNLLNSEDGGKRRCIMVTNNEIGEEKERELSALGIHQGDEEWEKWGIARYVNWPRTKCSIMGKDVNDEPIDGEYLTTITKTEESDRKFTQINFLAANASLKQKKKVVTLINKQKGLKLPTMNTDQPFLVSEDESCNASILFDVSHIDDWLDELDGKVYITNLYVVTDRDATFRQVKSEVSAQMGKIEESVPITLPMKDGFKANAIYFKLGFLDKNAVALGRQFRELLPLLWMKAGAKGVCPTLDSDEVPAMLVLPENHFAVLVDERHFALFKETIDGNDKIETVYFVTNSDITYREMAGYIGKRTTYQLYKDYLDNFRINRPQN